MSDLICFFWFMFSTWYRFCLLVCLLLFVCLFYTGWKIRAVLICAWIFGIVQNDADDTNSVQSRDLQMNSLVKSPTNETDTRTVRDSQLRVDLNKSIFWATSSSKYIFIATVFTFLIRNDADSCEAIKFLMKPYQVTMDCRRHGV